MPYPLISDDHDRRQGWASVIAGIRDPGSRFSGDWETVFGPLRSSDRGGGFAVGQIGQSLDGRIATPTGHSFYINGADGLDHLHRLRALVDAVMVGIGTAQADDPQLTVRRVEGASPARVLLDPNGKLGPKARLFTDDGMRRLVITCRTDAEWPAGVEIVPLPRTGGVIEPRAILEALAQRGLSRVLVEGGAQTVSRFLCAGCLDRLHVVVSPIVLGSGATGLNLPPIERADQAMRMPMHIHRLGDEVLFDCDPQTQFSNGGSVAKTSM